MKLTFKLLSVCLLTIFLIGCGTESSSDLSVKDLEGSWSANSFILTNKSNSSETYNFVANGGTLDFTVLSDGRTRFWVSIGESSDEWDSQMTIDGNKLTLTPAESIRQTLVVTVEMNEAGDVVTFTNQDEEFDFTLSGSDPVPATSVGVYARK